MNYIARICLKKTKTTKNKTKQNKLGNIQKAIREFNENIDLEIGFFPLAYCDKKLLLFLNQHFMGKILTVF